METFYPEAHSKKRFYKYLLRQWVDCMVLALVFTVLIGVFKNSKVNLDMTTLLLPIILSTLAILFTPKVKEVKINEERGLVTLNYYRLLEGNSKAVFYIETMTVKRKKVLSNLFRNSQALAFKAKYGRDNIVSLDKDQFSETTLLLLENELIRIKQNLLVRPQEVG